MFRSLQFFSLAVIAATVLLGANAGQSQVRPNAVPRVTQGINESQMVTRRGNVHPAVFASTTVDLGPTRGDKRLEHMYLQLQRSAQEEQALQAYLDDLQNPKSANFHKWGTAAQFSQQFGIAASDLDSVKSWLESHGMVVNVVYPNLVIDFSGTVGQVEETFHTQIHNLTARGEHHIANISEPQIPAALASVVMGPVALHDFKPKMLTTKRTPKPDYTVSADSQLVAPGDLATIYNYNPLYATGITGEGQTVVVLERTDLYSTGDFDAFRQAFGLTSNYPDGSLVTVHPQPNGIPVTAPNGVTFGPETCSDPGDVMGDDGEAAVDAEWASASAPSATIELASCADTATNFGGFIALENLLTSTTPPPPIMSLTYTSSESDNGTDGNAYVNALYQVAVYEGVSLFVASGDADADVTDQNQQYATHGINVNALASTPNDVAVGGTDYGDTFLGEDSVYWNANNNPYFASALSYIPEIPWNNSCASQLNAIVLGYPTTYGAGGFCNSAIGEAGYLTTAGGSGGPSACAYGAAAVPGVVSGTCTGYAKPAYQTLVYGNPADGVRDLPDVSMFAGTGIWGHLFVFCYSNPTGGLSCPADNPSTWASGGGTSFGAAIWAGIQALINQATASAEGNPDFFYYLLGGTEYGASGNPSCNSTFGNSIGPSCIFNDVTLGDNDANCRKLNGVAYNCFFGDNSINGVLSTSNTSYQPAYVTTTGYDFATGIGTPNVFNLVANFPGATIPSPSNVTIATSPSGLLVSVDGHAAQAAPVHAIWLAGSKHTIATTSPQQGTGARYTFSSWSDGGAISHTITVPANAVTYTASFSSQYQLTTSVSPSGAGTVSPASGGYYPAGTIVNVSTSGYAGYVFQNWSGSVANPSKASTTVTMSAPETVTANYTELPTQLAGSLNSKSGPSTARVWRFLIENTGPGAANAAQISSVTLTQTLGPPCTPQITTPLPLALGNMAPTSYVFANVTINFGSCSIFSSFNMSALLSANQGRATGTISLTRESQ